MEATARIQAGDDDGLLRVGESSEGNGFQRVLVCKFGRIGQPFRTIPGTFPVSWENEQRNRFGRESIGFGFRCVKFEAPVEHQSVAVHRKVHI